MHPGSTADDTSPYLMATGMKRAEAAGCHQMLFISQNDELYYVGWRIFDTFAETDSASGQLCLVARNIKSADIQNSHIVYICNDGGVWGYGFNEKGQIRQSAQNTLLKHVNIANGAIDVSAGDGFTGILMDDGEILTLGDDSYGQGGNGAVSASPVYMESAFAK